MIARVNVAGGNTLQHQRCEFDSHLVWSCLWFHCEQLREQLRELPTSGAIEEAVSAPLPHHHN